MSEEWHGGEHRPHTTSNLRKLKKELKDGTQVLLRNQPATVRATHGKQGRKRRTEDGLVLNVIPVDATSNDLANQIVSEKFAYVSRNGISRPLFATFSGYQILSPMTSVGDQPRV